MLIARQAFRGKADSEAGLSQAGEPDEEEDGAEQSDAVPNGDDTSFEDLMEYIILQVNNPKGEEEGDASVVYNIRIEAVRELLDASTIKDWTNGQVGPKPETPNPQPQTPNPKTGCWMRRPSRTGQMGRWFLTLVLSTPKSYALCPWFLSTKQ